MLGLRAKRRQPPRRRIAHRIGDLATAQGVRPNADAILVQVAFPHGVAEGQRVLVAVGKRGLAAGRADLQHEDGIAVHLHHVVENNCRLHRFADAVGVAAVRVGSDGGRGRHARRHAVHLVLVIRGHGVELARGGVAAAVADVAAAQGRGARADADAVLVHVARLHGVGEQQRRGAAAAGVERLPGVRADGEGQRRLAGDVDNLAELDLHLDRLADAVGLAPIRRRRDGGQPFHVWRRAVHLVRLVRMHGREVAGRGIAAVVADRAAGQRVRTRADADAVAIRVAGLHGVGEQQDRGAAAAGVEGLADVRADGKGQPRLAGDMHHFAERDAYLDHLADAVGAVALRGLDARRPLLDHRGLDVRAGVHLVLRLRRQGRHPARFVPLVAGAVGDSAETDRVGVHGDAVPIEIPVRHDVAETQAGRTAAAHELRRCGAAAHVDVQHRVGAGAVRCHPNRLVEHHAQFDDLVQPVPIQVAQRRRVDRHRQGAWAHRVHLVQGIRRQGLEIRNRLVFRVVHDAPAQGGRADADAAFGHVAGLHRVVEGQSSGAAARVQRRLAQRRAHLQADRGDALGHPYGLVEPRLHHHGGADSVSAPSVRRGGDVHVLNKRRFGVDADAGVHGVDVLVLQVRQPTLGFAPVVAGDVFDDAAHQGVRADADAVQVDVAGLHLVAEMQRGRAAAAGVPRRARCCADGEGEHWLAGDVDDLVERDVHFDHLAAFVRVIRRLRHDGRRAGGGRAQGVHELGSPRHKRIEGARRGVAAEVLDDAADQRVGGDGDAVVVEVSGLHAIAEHQQVRAAAVRVGGAPVVGADAEHQRRLTAHLHPLVEADHQLDDGVQPVGAASGRCGANLHEIHRRRGLIDVGVHLAPAVLRQAREGERRGVAGGVLESAAGERARADADAVPVGVVGLHQIAEGQPGRAIAGEVDRRARLGADGEADGGRAGDDEYGLAERHLHVDVVVQAVGVLARWRQVGEAHAGDHRRQIVAAAVDAVAGVAGERRQAAVGPSVAHGVLDGAAGERVRGDAHAVFIAIAGLHNVLKLQDAVLRRHSGEPGFPGGPADAQAQRRLAADENALGEGHLDDDRFANSVAARPRTRGDARRPGGSRRHAVHLVRGIDRQCAVRANRHVCGGGVVDDLAAGEGVGRNVDAVVVAIFFRDGVAEGQGVGGVVLRREPRRARDHLPATAHFQLQHRALQFHPLTADNVHFEHVRGLAEDHLHFDDLAGGVGVADLRRGGDAQQLDAWRLVVGLVGAGVHAVRGLREQRCETAPGGRELVAGAVGDGAVDEGVGADGDAVVVVVAGLHGVAELQRRRAAAAVVRGPRRAPTDGEAQARSGVHPHRLVEGDLHDDHIAGFVHLVGAELRRDGHAGGARRHRVHPVPGGVDDGRKRGVVAQGVGANADAVGVLVARLHGVGVGELGRAARFQRGLPRQVADGEDEAVLRGATGAQQVHAHADHVAGGVGGILARVGDDGCRGAGGAAVHAMGGLGGEGGPAQVRRVVRKVGDRAASERARRHFDAVPVIVALLHHVLECQSPVAAAIRGCEQAGRAGVGADAEVQRQARRVGDADRLGERQLRADGLAALVGVAEAGAGGERDRLHAGRHAVRLDAGVAAAGLGDAGLVAGGILQSGGVGLQFVRRDGHLAVVYRVHAVEEHELRGAAAAGVTRDSLLTAYVERQGGTVVAGENRLVELDVYGDVGAIAEAAAGVGWAAGHAHGRHAGRNRVLAAIDRVVAIVR